MMEVIDFSKCTYKDMYQSTNGRYNIFYDVPKEELVKTHYGKSFEEFVVSGVIGLHIVKDNPRSPYALLWILLEGDDEDEAVEYDGDVSEFTKDALKRIEEREGAVKK